jgi:hypothetical protein
MSFPILAVCVPDIEVDACPITTPLPFSETPNAFKPVELIPRGPVEIILATAECVAMATIHELTTVEM